MHDMAQAYSIKRIFASYPRLNLKFSILKHVDDV